MTTTTTTAATEHPVHELIARRWSPYAFADRPVRRGDLQSLLEAARWAPSSYNEQPWRFIVALREEPEQFERLLSCQVEGNQAWARFAPVLALGIVSRNFERNGKPNPAAEHDLGLAAAHLTFEATARGLCVHQMIGIVPDRARQVYSIPEEFLPKTGIAIGYPGTPDSLPEALRGRDAARRSRKQLREIVFGGAWGRASPLA